MNKRQWGQRSNFQRGKNMEQNRHLIQKFKS